MTNIYDTTVNYLTCCRGENTLPNEFIQKVLNNEKEGDALETGEEMYLKLCGNNKILTNSRLTDDDVKILCKSLKGNSFITAIDLRCNRITDVGAGYLAELLVNNNYIKELVLISNDIESKGAELLANALLENNTLQSLNLTGNKIGDKGGMQFAQALQVNESLAELDLGNCDLKIDSVIALATVLNYNSTLRSLNVARPLLWTHQEEPVVHIADMLKKNKTLKEIHLNFFNMTDFGAARIADSLIDNFSLTILDLSSNRITRDGANLLATVLKQNTSLTVLDLAYNSLECDGAVAIADALATFNTNLKSFIVTYNRISGRGISALTKALKLNNTLTSLYIWGNDFDETSCLAVNELYTSGRLTEDGCDVRPCAVDEKIYVCQLSHDAEYRKFRYTAPIYGSDIPKLKKYRIS